MLLKPWLEMAQLIDHTAMRENHDRRHPLQAMADITRLLIPSPVRTQGTADFPAAPCMKLFSREKLRPKTSAHHRNYRIFDWNHAEYHRAVGDDDYPLIPAAGWYPTTYDVDVK